MALVTDKIILNADVKTVWQFVTNTANFSKYVSGYVEGKTKSQNSIGVDAEYEWYGKFWKFKIKSVEKIVAWNEQKYVAYSGKMFGIKFDSSMQINALEKNKTLLTVGINYNVPFFFLGKIVDLVFVKKLVESYVKESLNNLKSTFNTL